MRPPSPSPSASGSITFAFESSASIASTRNRSNFWDYEAYSRSFLHERKMIEKEVRLGLRIVLILTISIYQYVERGMGKKG